MSEVAGILRRDDSLRPTCIRKGRENMTLREAAGTLKRGRRVYNIGFNVFDETQFTAYGIRDLEECWDGFCEDEGLEKDCVDYVEEAPKL